MLRALVFGIVLSFIWIPSVPRSSSQNIRAITLPAAPTVEQKSNAGTDARSRSDEASSNSLEEAIGLYRKGEFIAASDKFQQILKENPKSPEAYAGLTRVYLKRKDVQSASQTISKALTLADSPPVHVAQGEVLFRQGKISEAEKEWANVINSGHADARAYLGLARVRAAISHYKQAKTMIDKAHALDAADPEIQKRWIATLSRSERIKYLEQYLGSPSNEDSESRKDTQRYLDYLKARASGPAQGCHLVGEFSAMEMPLVRLLRDANHLRGFGLAVKVNEHKTRLMLDTGASGILLDRGAAEKSGITKLTDTRIGGIGDAGRRNGYVGLAKSIKVGNLEFQNCPVEVLDSRSVVDEEGLIGADVFEDFLVDIDFPHEMFRLRQLPKPPDEVEGHAPGLHSEEDSSPAVDNSENPSPAGTGNQSSGGPASQRFRDAYISPEMKSYTRIFRFGHELLIPTQVSNSPSKLFLIDTGSLTNEISLAAAREVTKVRTDENVTVKGINGAVKKVYSADSMEIQFGHLKQDNEDLLTFDLTPISDHTGTEVSGILGFVMLRLLDLRIDYRDGLVDFDYKPSPWE